MKNNKSLGQHWLRDRATLDTIAELCATGATSSTCLEIGPGLGTLTAALLRRFEHVVAVEYDERLAHNLPGSFPGKHLTVIHQDFLDFDLNSIPRPYVVAGNIPYYITSPIIQKLLGYTPGRISSHSKYTPERIMPLEQYAPERIVLLIQKEVAQRIAATPGRHTYLSILVQSRARVTLGPVVGRELFTPPPRVDSQVIILDPLPAPVLSDSAIKLAKLGFSAPRKKLAHNLSAGLHRPRTEIIQLLTTCDIDPDVRPATLNLSAWEHLADMATSNS